MSIALITGSCGLVRLYKRMHDKGLEIVGVSLDKNQSSCLEKKVQQFGKKIN